MKIEGTTLVTVSNEDIENGTFIIPDGIIEIDSFAFYNCTHLKSINIPDSVTVIEDYVFDNCTNLQSIYIPNSVTYIGSWAFQYCTNLESITIPKSLKYIGVGAFANCKKLIKKGKYKACNIIRDGDNITYSCRGTIFEIGKQMPVIDDIEGCNIGYDYFENLYDIFNYYYGYYYDDLNNIALFEVEPGDIIEKNADDSKCVTNTIKLVRQIPWNEAFGD